MTELIHFHAHNPKKYLLFDFDETLFYLHLPWDTFRKELKSKLRVLDKQIEMRLDYKNTSGTAPMNKAVRMYGQKAKKIVTDWSGAFERDYLKKVNKNSELIEFIKKHRSKYAHFIWSSNMHATVTRLLTQEGLHDYFVKLLTQDVVSLIKPYPDAFYMIFDPKRHIHNQFLMIGNSDKDEHAAKACGIEFFRVDTEQVSWD